MWGNDDEVQAIMLNVLGASWAQTKDTKQTDDADADDGDDDVKVLRAS